MSSSVLQLQKKEGPSSEAWETHKEKIAEHYQSKTLKEVMKMMEDEHQFHASLRMYKSRITKWSLEKNIKSREALVMMQLKQQRDAVHRRSEFRVRGRIVPLERIQRHLKSNQRYPDSLNASVGQHPLSTIVVRTPSPTPSITSSHPVQPQASDDLMLCEWQNPGKLRRLDNLPWFEFQDQFHAILKAQGINLRDRTANYDPLLNHEPGCLNPSSHVSLVDGLQLWSSMSEESRDLRYNLDLLGEQHESELGAMSRLFTCSLSLREREYKRDISAMKKPTLGTISDVLFAQWASEPPKLDTEENFHTLHSNFRPFILERQEGELQEGIGIILGPLYVGGLLQFLNYTINLLSNNLFLDSDVDKIVQSIDELQGHELLAKLLSVKSPTIEAFASNLLPGAIRLKNVSITRTLLEAGTSPNSIMGRTGETPLQYAAMIGDTKLVWILLKAGADVNAPPGPRGYTALQAAVLYGSIEVVPILLKAGADVNASPRPGRYTALQAAARRGSIKVVQILLKAGADVNAPPRPGRYTALQAAAWHGNIEVVQILLKAGADVNAPPVRGGYTALQAAALNGNIEVVQILLKAGADVNAPPGSGGYTALQEAARRGNIDLVKVLLSAGADINAPPAKYSGRTALQTATENEYVGLVRMLLNAGADVNASPAEILGRTALQAASMAGNIELVQILLNAGADVNAFPSHTFGVTALQAAAIQGQIRMVELLLNAGADVNAAPSIVEGRTALEGAAEHGRLDLLQLLINAGANTDSSQCTRAIKFAARNGHGAVCGFLNRWISPVMVEQIKEHEDYVDVNGIRV